MIIFLCGAILLPNVLFAQADYFTEPILTRHNELRYQHGAPALKWNKKIADYAANYAKKLAKDKNLNHNPEKKYGENLMRTKLFGMRDMSGAQPADAWYGEIKDYNFAKAAFTPGTGHFTQLVWKGNKEVGCGRATSADGSIYIVCNYSPGGNVDRQYAANVLKPIDLPADDPNAKDLTREAMGKILEPMTFAMGNGVVFMTKFCLQKSGYWRSPQTAKTMVYGGFIKPKNSRNKVGYVCPSLGNVTFTINEKSIVWEVNKEVKETIKKFGFPDINSKGVIRR